MATKKKSSARKKSSSSKKKSTAKKGSARKKSATKSRAKTKRKGGGRANAAFMKPMQPSASLSAVVGSSPLPRTEVTKKLWAYIKRKGLQDNKNRRMINADDSLRPVFGGKRQVSMFEMTKLVNKHLS
ncbi:MAG TPA: SWIB/MDM2 domain-containing protein [Gemmatimonadaceae bacterium]|nr:SWIB/MDM2 domain-containing protein [Gemmatimonadaceae bacterium]